MLAVPYRAVTTSAMLEQDRLLFLHVVKRSFERVDDEAAFKEKVKSRRYAELGESEVLFEPSDVLANQLGLLGACMSSNQWLDRGFAPDNKSVACLLQDACVSLFDMDIQSPLVMEEFHERPGLPSESLLRATLVVESFLCSLCLLVRQQQCDPQVIETKSHFETVEGGNIF